MMPAAPDERDSQSVRGERSVALVTAARSVQSRVSSALAAVLMIALGIAALAWYYAHALTRPGQARALAQSAATTRAQGEMALPSLGRITPPPAAANAPPLQEVPRQSVEPQEPPLAEAHPPASPWSAAAAADSVAAGRPGGSAAKSPA